MVPELMRVPVCPLKKTPASPLPKMDPPAAFVTLPPAWRLTPMSLPEILP
jgi:hypothetical protein